MSSEKMACSTDKLIAACDLDPLSFKRIARKVLNSGLTISQDEERGSMQTVCPA
jgi:hypothetical protein